MDTSPLSILTESYWLQTFCVTQTDRQTDTSTSPRTSFRSLKTSPTKVDQYASAHEGLDHVFFVDTLEQSMGK